MASSREDKAPLTYDEMGKGTYSSSFSMDSVSSIGFLDFYFHYFLISLLNFSLFSAIFTYSLLSLLIPSYLVLFST
jgi:hypothetical protein